MLKKYRINIYSCIQGRKRTPKSEGSQIEKSWRRRNGKTESKKKGEKEGNSKERGKPYKTEIAEEEGIEKQQTEKERKLQREREAIKNKKAEEEEIKKQISELQSKLNLPKT